MLRYLYGLCDLPQVALMILQQFRATAVVTLHYAKQAFNYDRPNDGGVKYRTNGVAKKWTAELNGIWLRKEITLCG